MSRVSDYIKNNIGDIVYDCIYYDYPDISHVSIDKVCNGKGYDVDPRLVMYIQNIASAWRYMTFMADSNDRPVVSVSELCTYNRICFCNLCADNGELRPCCDDAKETSSSSISNYAYVIHNSIFGRKDTSVKERACSLYCDILKVNMFNHGTELAARIAASFYLMSNDEGFFNVPARITDTVKKYTDEIIKGGSTTKMVKYLMKNAIIGG